jgi:hypothetical protein
MADINDIFVNSIDDNPLEVQNAVNALMQQKVADAINHLRGEISSSYFGSYGGQEEQEVEELSSEEDTDNSVYEDDVDTSYEDSSLEDLLQELEDTNDQENS